MSLDREPAPRYEVSICSRDRPWVVDLAVYERPYAC